MIPRFADPPGKNTAERTNSGQDDDNRAIARWRPPIRCGTSARETTRHQRNQQLIISTRSWKKATSRAPAAPSRAAFANESMDEAEKGQSGGRRAPFARMLWRLRGQVMLGRWPVRQPGRWRHELERRDSVMLCATVNASTSAAGGSGPQGNRPTRNRM